MLLVDNTYLGISSRLNENPLVSLVQNRAYSTEVIEAATRTFE